MKTNNFMPIIFGALFVILGILLFAGLITFAVPCTRLLDNGMVTRCHSLAVMQQGLGIVIALCGAFLIIFRKNVQWCKALAIVLFLLGIMLVISAVGVTDTCNVRAHTLQSEQPAQENVQIHRDFLVEGENFYVVWTNFDCNEGMFTPFVMWMGIALIGLVALFVMVSKFEKLEIKPAAKNGGIAFIIAGILTLIGLRTFAQPCLDFAGTNLMPMFMRCYDVAVHVQGAAIIAIIAGVLMILYSSSKAFGVALSAAVGILGVYSLVLPFLTETCGNLTMVCNTGPFTAFINVMGGILAVIAILSCIILLKKSSEDDDEEDAQDEA